VFRELKVVSAQLWRKTPRGQHIELGIAENNLFIQLAALGLSHELFGTRLLPIGTLYDPFIARGLDALNYACYQDARFMIVATPSGVTLAPEGGAHQSIHTPLIGIGQPGCCPTSRLRRRARGADALGPGAHAAGQGLLDLPAPVDPQPGAARAHAVAEQQADIVDGGYWYAPPEPDADIAIVCMGAVTPEAIAAHEQRGARLRRRGPAGADLARPPACRLARGASAIAAAPRVVDRSPAPVERLLAPLSRDAGSSPCSTAIRWRCRGWAACAASASCRSASKASASRATFPTSTAPIGSIGGDHRRGARAVG
jgi:pyruvate dehydrogenase E1 component